MTAPLIDGCVYNENRVAIYQGDVRSVLSTLPAESVQCCVTSPPYWGLRDYGVDNQLGLERTPEEYIAAMVGVFRSVKRLLRHDGTLWLNMGDSYAGSWGAQGRQGENGDMADCSVVSARQIAVAAKKDSHTGTIPKGSNLKPKDLVGMPWMLAFALRADGWYLRSDIIWAKPNPMPESVTDRPTKAHEYIFLLTKSERYFYDADAIREEGTRYEWNTQKFKGGDLTKHHGSTVGGEAGDESAGRNKRSVWEVATQAFPEAHFATFPEDLIQPCILAGTSEKGCCAQCGTPWARIVEVRRSNESGSGKALQDRTPGGWHQSGSERWRPEHVGYFGPKGKMAGGTQVRDDHDIRLGPTTSTHTIGWEPTCKCFTEENIAEGDTVTRPCTVLDPFFGSGTTALVARKNGCRAIGVELNPAYIEIAKRRLRQSVLPF